MFTYFKLEKFVDTLFIVTKTDYFYPRENERSHPLPEAHLGRFFGSFQKIFGLDLGKTPAQRIQRITIEWNRSQSGNY
jgi:MoxR-like ATPase